MIVYLVKRIENIKAKGEIAHHEQFPQLPQYFQKSSAAEASICGKGLINPQGNNISVWLKQDEDGLPNQNYFYVGMKAIVQI